MGRGSGGMPLAHSLNTTHALTEFVCQMEGSIEFLDAPGEWHFDPSTRDLYVFPPRGVSLDSTTTELVLTQTDTLFEFIGESSDAGLRVEHIVFDSLSFAYTSAQFFRPHEETSGGLKYFIKLACSFPLFPPLTALCP